MAFDSLPEAIAHHARQRRLSRQDSAQVFMQAVVLSHLGVPGARLIGGTALVLGYGNPRFSEDVDLSGIDDPMSLGPGLSRARAELEGWFRVPVVLGRPAREARTWRLTARFGRSQCLRLHVDSQPQSSLTVRPLVIEYTSIPPFVIEGAGLDELMSDKVLAVALRRYLGGRDLFDLWFHWLRSDSWADRRGAIMDLLDAKLGERSIGRAALGASLARRLSTDPSLARAREEWKRYLPPEFQKPAVVDDIVARCRLLLGMLP